jgi:hypothetical protein
MPSRLRSSLAAVGFAFVLACGGSTSSGGGGPDGGGNGTDGATSADGGGVCCPITGTPPCGCAGGGGWAASASACTTGGTCDAWMATTVDAHGCPALVLDGSKCCGCPPIRDAGADTGAGGACADSTQCRLFSDDCGGCRCDALGPNDPNPTCDAGVSCLVDPCQGKAAVCDSSKHCVAM